MLSAWGRIVTALYYGKRKLSPSVVDLSWTQTESLRFLAASRSILFSLSAMTTFSEVSLRIKFPVDYWSSVLVRQLKAKIVFHCYALRHMVFLFYLSLSCWKRKPESTDWLDQRKELSPRFSRTDPKEHNNTQFRWFPKCSSSRLELESPNFVS